MAEYLPLAVGVLAGLCVFGLLSVWTGSSMRMAGSAPATQDFAASAAQAFRRVAQVTGGAVPVAVRMNPWVKRCGEELTEIPWCSRLLFGGAAGERNGSAEARVVPAGARHDMLTGALLILTVAGGVVAAMVSGSLVGMGIGAPLVPAALYVRARRRMQAEARRVEAEMPEAFASLAIALGSDHSLAQGMRFVGSHAQEPVRSEFIRVSLAVECGIPAGAALDELMDRLPAPGMGFVSLALKISQRTGAPLRELLAEAANMVAERIELTRRLDVKTSQVRMSARMVAVMPIAMIFVLTMLSPDFRAGLVTPVGMGSVAVALAFNVCAWLIIRRIMEVRIS